MDTEKQSGLFYFGTSDDVRLGDTVEMKGWFGRKRIAEVVYIPGISPVHPDLEYEDVKQWAIRDEQGTVFAIVYDPHNFQPPRKIRLISRSALSRPLADEHLE